MLPQKFNHRANGVRDEYHATSNRLRCRTRSDARPDGVGVKHVNESVGRSIRTHKHEGAPEVRALPFVLLACPLFGAMQSLGVVGCFAVLFGLR